jgi:hypothetical protein
MKKYCLAALSALVVFAGCGVQEQEITVPDSVKTVRFHAATADTRTAFAEAVNGEYATLWTGNDSEILLSLNYGEAEKSAVTVSADGRTATFEAAFDASSASAPYTFYAVSPASAARAISPSRKAWSVSIAADQTPSALSVDEAAQLLVAKTAAVSKLPDEVDLHFSHLTAYGRLSLKNLELGEAKVLKVDLIFSTPIVGEWYWGEDGTLTANGDSHTITLHTDATGDLWFACAPVDVSGQTLKLVLFTDHGNLTKEITFPEGRSFASGKVARFSVDMSGIELQRSDAFCLLTDVSVMKEGDKYLILNADETYALGPLVSSSTPYRERVSVEVKDGIVVDPGDATVLELRRGVSAGTWSFHTGSGYLAAGKTGDALREIAGRSDYSSWVISISGKAVTMQAQKGESTYLRYSSSYSRFSCYSSASSQKGIVLYRLAGAETGAVKDDPLTKKAEYGCYIKSGERTYVKGVDQLMRSYPDGNLEFVILNAPAKEQLIVSGFDPSLRKGDFATVSAQFRRGFNVLFEGTYTLKVVKEDGPTVWLGDGTGQGFILKK